MRHGKGMRVRRQRLTVDVQRGPNRARLRKRLLAPALASAFSPFEPTAGWTYYLEAAHDGPATEWPACPFRFLGQRMDLEIHSRLVNRAESLIINRFASAGVDPPEARLQCISRHGAEHVRA